MSTEQKWTERFAAKQRARRIVGFQTFDEEDLKIHQPELTHQQKLGVKRPEKIIEIVG